MILLDTTPLVALCDERDALHERAKADLDRLERQTLGTCASVLTEACFLLESVTKRERLSRLLSAFAVRPIVIDADASAWPRIFAWLSRYGEHEPDWADAVLVVAASIDRRAKVWTYDKEFRTTWRREDGSKLPPAVK